MENYSRTFTISAKVTASEKIRYTKIAKSHDVSFSEWIASILNMYHDSYDELKINYFREYELLNEIDKLKRKVNLLEASVEMNKTIMSSKPYLSFNKKDRVLI